jgi:ribosomal protein S18 acetylase RimI-like enzyme
MVDREKFLNTVSVQKLDHPPSAEMLDLLLLADPNLEAITSYLPGEKIVVASVANKLIGIAVLIVNEVGHYELKNIAVKEDYQGQGVAKLLIRRIKVEAKTLGAEQLYIGTGNSGFDQLALYQKCGFRICGVKPNFFASYDPPIFENGIRCLDMVMLVVAL